MGVVEKCGTQVSLPAGWADSSDDAGNSDRLLTLTKPDGVGAFQMSFGQYVSGKLPNIRLDDLRDLLAEFAATLRASNPPMVGYIADDRFKLDLRTIFPQQDDFVIGAIRAACTK